MVDAQTKAGALRKRLDQAIERLRSEQKALIDSLGNANSEDEMNALSDAVILKMHEIDALLTEATRSDITEGEVSKLLGEFRTANQHIAQMVGQGNSLGYDKHQQQIILTLKQVESEKARLSLEVSIADQKIKSLDLKKDEDWNAELIAKSAALQIIKKWEDDSVVKVNGGVTLAQIEDRIHAIIESSKEIAELMLAEAEDSRLKVPYDELESFIAALKEMDYLVDLK